MGRDSTAGNVFVATIAITSVIYFLKYSRTAARGTRGLVVRRWDGSGHDAAVLLGQSDLDLVADDAHVRSSRRPRSSGAALARARRPCAPAARRWDALADQREGGWRPVDRP